MEPGARAEKCLDDLIGEETTIGYLSAGRENDPNRWRPRGTAGESYKVILAAIRDAVAAEKKRIADGLRWIIRPDPDPAENAVRKAAAALFEAIITFVNGNEAAPQ